MNKKVKDSLILVALGAAVLTATVLGLQQMDKKSGKISKQSSKALKKLKEEKDRITDETNSLISSVKKELKDSRIGKAINK